MDSSVLNIARPMPAVVNLCTLCVVVFPEFSISSFNVDPGSMFMSVALYWSACAWRATIIDFSQVRT